MGQPNLLFLYSDEQRFDTLAAYGNSQIRMPNLNRLAERATVFQRAYVTQPVCTPSRSSLLTGLYPHSNGCVANNIPLRPETPCLPEMLPSGPGAAWDCAHMGKWHLGDEIYPQHGFPLWISTEDTYHAFYSAGHEEFADRSSYHHWLVRNGIEPEDPGLSPEEAARQPWTKNRFFRQQIHRLPEERTRPAFLAERASAFLEGHRETPFALYVNFLEPHMPFYSCRDPQYDPAEVELPENFMERLSEDHHLRSRLKAEAYSRFGYDGDDLATADDWRRLIARYWGMNSLIDTHIGTILDTLEQTGLAESTIVCFTSDHGDMMSSHHLLGKGEMFEESARVPLLIAAPGQTERRMIDAPVSQIDVVPTLLELLGVEPPAHLEGESLAAQVTGVAGDEALAERDVFIEWNRQGLHAPKGEPLRDHAWAEATERQPGAEAIKLAEVGGEDPARVQAALDDNLRTVVTQDRWKLNLSQQGYHELFDLTADPRERVNRIGDPEQRARVGDMAGRIRAWQARTADPVRLPDPSA